MKNSLFKLVMLVFCLMLLISFNFAESGKKALPSKATTVEEKLKGSTVHNKPIESQQMQVLSVSTLDDKGKQLKWQVVSSGAVEGGTSVIYQLSRTSGYMLSGTVGQLAVGPGSSDSYGINSGYWQGFEECPGQGDANGSGSIDLADAVFIVNWLFIGGPPPDPLCLGDANRSGSVDLADAVYIVNWLFIGGPPPGC